LHAWNEVCHLSQSSKPVFTGFLSRCMQYWLKSHWLGICSNTTSVMDEEPLMVSMPTDCISNLTILSNNVCMLTSEENGIAWSHTSSVTRLNSSWYYRFVKKWWAGALIEWLIEFISPIRMGTQEVNTYECAPNIKHLRTAKKLWFCIKSCFVQHDFMQNHKVMLYKKFNYKRLQELYRNSRDQTNVMDRWGTDYYF